MAPWLVMFAGWIIHVFADRKPNRRTGHRVVELLLLWLLVFQGAWAAFGGLGHISGTSAALAENIGYAPSMFQWEVGFGDIAIGVLGIGCAWRRHRDGWMTAAVVALAISFGGDAIGHIMQYVAHDNDAPANVWAIPGDIAQPLLAIILLIVYRSGAKKLAASSPADAAPVAGT